MENSAKATHPIVDEATTGSWKEDGKPKVPLPWVKKNTAILIVHGIGFQRPLETLDQFGTGLVKTYQFSGRDLALKHIVVQKARSGGNNFWLDNVIRIHDKTDRDGPYIDLYEYYWANMTEDRSSWLDISKWLNDVIANATKFYQSNATLGRTCGDKSLFFSAKGEFRQHRYKLILNSIVLTSQIITSFTDFISWLLSYIPIPFFRKIAISLQEWINRKAAGTLINLLGDIVLYNVVNPRSKDYEIRKKILDGATNAVQYLFEKEQGDKIAYDSIIISGHSLGSQIAYDAINRLILFANQEAIGGYHSRFTGTTDYFKNIENQFGGFITFGSPLDKAAFFFREQVTKEQFVKSGILNDYLCFRQKKWYSNVAVTPTIEKLFDSKPVWKNYYDRHDYVSGPLDFYENVENMNCCFNAGFFGFTHSRYWEERSFFEDVIQTFIK